jgi:RNA ligase (TIGR02306 family)
MLRKLASIQTISELEPIPNADFIEQATVMGWKVIVKKGEFSPGDLCVFFEVDSMLPDVEWAEFMKPRKFRVKTLKMRGVLSQGLALPISILGKPGIIWRTITKLTGKSKWKVDDNVTKVLGVKKHDPTVRGPGFDAGQFLGTFPSFIPKTDEIRLQSAMALLHEMKEHPFYISVKCDGSSGTFYKLDGEFFACSRNRTVKPGDNAFWEVAKKYSLPDQLPEGFAIQGEVCGPGIQKNRLELKEKDLFVFNVFDIKAGVFLDFSQMQVFCETHELRTVPIVQVVVNPDKFNYELSSWLDLAKGFYEGTKNRREGIVVRPLINTRSNRLHGGRLSFKVINNDYLLKDED